MAASTRRTAFGFLVRATLTAAAGVSLGTAQAAPKGTPVALAPAEFLARPWSDIEKAARGTTVVFGMWSGNDSINGWVDGFVAKRMKDAYGITVKRQPQKDPVDFVNKALSEKQAGRSQGSTDLVWINGENFKLAKDAGTLWGPFAAKLPSFATYYDASAPDVAFDFGTPVEGFEAPYGRAQFTFTFDSAKVKAPPTSLATLKAWCEKNPGRFTYPAPPDFTGSAFVRQAVYALTGGHAQYLTGSAGNAAGARATLTKNLPAAMDALQALEPCLWRKGTTYPDSLARLNQLYADGEVWMTMAYSPVEAENQMRKGVFPKSSRTFVFDEGTLANTHFVAIPFNAPNTAGALVLANFLLSPEAQISKLDPSQWGDFPAFDERKLSAPQRAALAKIDLGKATLAPAFLAARRVPEMPPALLIDIEAAWKAKVAR